MENNNTCYSQNVLNFIKKYDESHPNERSVKYHNIYEVQTVDMDGNVCETCFGINLMTDYGFKLIYARENHSSSYAYNHIRIWLGDSIEMPTFDNNKILSPITNSEPNGVTSYNGYASIDGIRFDKDDNLLYQTSKISYMYYDYNISDLNGNVITEDVHIREIGIGNSKDALRFHARIYNNRGELSAITKKPNQRLYITTYMTASMDPSFINEDWEHGIYTTFDMRHFTKFIGHDSYRSYPIFGYSANHTGCNRHNGTYDLGRLFYSSGSSDAPWNTYIPDENKIKWGYANYGGGLIEGKRQYLSEAYVGFIDTYVTTNSGYVMSWGGLSEWFVYNDEPEELENVTMYVGSRTGDGSFMLNFGRWYTGESMHGRLPVLDYNMTSCRMYNHKTKQWDIEEEFFNNPELNLYEFWLGRYLITLMYITFMEVNKECYVFVNKHPDRRIISFNNSGFTLYATDTYWDTDSWEIIPNLSSVSEELGSKRYYISLVAPSSWASDDGANTYGYYANKQSLITNRDIEPHRLIPSKPVKTYYNSFPHPTTNSGKTAVSDKYGYIVYSGGVIYPDDINPETELPYMFSMKADNGVPINYLNIYNFEKEDKVFVMGSPQGKAEWKNNRYEYPGGWAQGFRVYDMSDPDHTKAPTYTDYTWNIQVWCTNSYGSYPYYQRLCTKSTKGFLVFTPITINDVNNSTQFPFATIVNLYGGEDKNTVEIIDIPNTEVRSMMAIDRTNYICCYMRGEHDSDRIFKIYDVSMKKYIKTFEFESDHSIRGYCGWKNYVYFLTIKNSTRYSWIYHIDEDQLIYYPNEDYRIIETLMSNVNIEYNGAKADMFASDSTDDVFVIGIAAMDGNRNSNPPYYYEYANTYFTDKDPSKQHFVLKSNDIGSVNGAASMYATNLQLKYINNEDRQLICVWGGSRRMVGVDLGLRIDDPPDIDVDFFPYWNFPWYDSNRGGCLSIYKNRIFIIEANYSSTQAKIIDTPVEYWIKHKTTGTTRTITSWNNPVRVSNIKEAAAWITNRVDGSVTQENPWHNDNP